MTWERGSEKGTLARSAKEELQGKQETINDLGKGIKKHAAITEFTKACLETEEKRNEALEDAIVDAPADLSKLREFCKGCVDRPDKTSNAADFDLQRASNKALKGNLDSLEDEKNETDVKKQGSANDRTSKEFMTGHLELRNAGIKAKP